MAPGARSRDVPCQGRNEALPGRRPLDWRKKIQDVTVEEMMADPTSADNVEVEAPVRTLESIPDTERAKEIPKDDPDADLHTDPDVDASEMEMGLELPTQWRVAKALLALREQVNAMAPNRSKLSDGTIGDPSHQSRASDHNPWVRDGGIGVVTALDITHDPANGCDAETIAQTICRRKDARVKYIIWNRRISSSSPIHGQPAWAWRDYNGRNPHTKHVHISVKSEKASYDAASGWSITSSEGSV